MTYKIITTENFDKAYKKLDKQKVKFATENDTLKRGCLQSDPCPNLGHGFLHI